MCLSRSLSPGRSEPAPAGSKVMGRFVSAPGPEAQLSSADESPPFVLRFSSALGWALVFWVVCHVAAPVLKGAVDSCDHTMGAWTSSQLNHVITGHPDLGGIVFGIVFAIIQIPVVVVFGAFVM